MNYIVAILVALVCAIFTYINLNIDVSQKIKLLNVNRDEEVYSAKTISKKRIYISCVIIFFVSFAASISIYMNVKDVINIIKMNIVLVCMTGAAAMDYREHRIPNIYPLIMTVSGIAFLCIGYFMNLTGAEAYIASSVIATVGVGLGLVLVMFLTKQGIGLGDIKLLTALSVIGGVYTVCGTIFFAMIFCAIAALVLLVIKKKTIHESLPFGPFALAGYVITIFTSIY